ncbi:putative bifunctional diguanylate cyclase/phosphodiesterase [Dasania marina]|uniref:putative bifunctional diguanylate cyclase/phosphodiesterase n=1 Tax=Dasania marina TaxID=471499 RepID=UPI0003748C18|nr:bifunctional diguanylate cyclase/phosphodiesterase [Dasania marina]
MRDASVRILLAGGTQSQYQLLIEQLQNIKRQPYLLTWFEDYDHAERELAAESYDLALIDCQSDSERALYLLTSIQQSAVLPCITLFEHSDSELSVLAQDLGAVDCLCADNLHIAILERSFRYALDRSVVDQKLSQSHLYDPLTGISNRQMFRKTLDAAIETAKAQQTKLGLLLINLDGFKRINQAYSMDTADEMVRTMARRLSRCVRKSDRLARMGGDEFALILDDCRNVEDVALVAQKVIDVLSAPYMIEGAPVIISCSIGVTMYPESGESVDGLLKRANMAMMEAKSERGSQYHFYSEETQVGALQRVNLEKDLRVALRANQFEMYYQPRVDLRSGETVGMEGLIRWHHPKRGLVSPAEFIPLAEECGLIIPIGYWVIQQACKDMKYFDSTGKTNLHVAVNLSFKQLQDNMFVDTAARIIKDSAVDAHRLEFELTETAIMSNFQQTYEGMMALSQLGITFSLDDFGTGFSSFAHIQRLPISALKIDRSFVSNVISDFGDAEIVKAMINLAHSLKINVIAEGAETLEQIQFLWENNCEQVQGYYFSPAVSAKDFCAIVDQRMTVTA